MIFPQKASALLEKRRSGRLGLQRSQQFQDAGIGGRFVFLVGVIPGREVGQRGGKLFGRPSVFPGKSAPPASGCRCPRSACRSLLERSASRAGCRPSWPRRPGRRWCSVRCRPNRREWFYHENQTSFCFMFSAPKRETGRSVPHGDAAHLEPHLPRAEPASASCADNVPPRAIGRCAGRHPGGTHRCSGDKHPSAAVG